MKIEGCVALVTGANRGIGEALVRELLSMGAARVYAACREPGSAGHLVAEDAGRVIEVTLDVTDDRQMQEAAARCPDVTLLINNAGYSVFGRRLIESPDLAVARAEMEVNYFGTLRACRVFAPVLKRGGGGAIVNILSAAALSNVPVLGSYSASKAATYSLTQGVRAELASQGTLVCAVFVGSVDTRMAAAVRDAPKVTPDHTARATLQGLQRREEEIDADPMTIDLRARLARDPKKLERFLARGLRGVAPV